MHLNKLELRTIFKHQRDSMNFQQFNNLSKQIEKNLLSLPEILLSTSFYIYASIANEVQTPDLLDCLLKQDKIVTVPKIISWYDDDLNIAGIMRPYKLTNFSQLKKTKKGCYEPDTEEYLFPIDVAIMPCLAVTEQGHRLGMGGGFYDKFIENYPDMKLIALAYNWQIQNSLPTKNHDKLVDIIVTENQVIRTNSQF